MFDVLFLGKTVSGADLQQVKTNIATLFKINEAQVAKLFAGQPVVIKSGLDEGTAQKYRMAIEKAGAICEVRPTAGQSPAAQTQPPPAAPPPSVTPAPPPAATTQSPPATTAAADLTGAYTVAPLGVELGDNPPFIPADINLDHLSTAPVGADLEELKPDVEIVNIDVDFDVAPAGSDLEEMPRVLLPLVMSDELEQVEVAPVGADLSDAKPQEVPPIKELVVDIAPAGSDLGQAPSEKAPVNPDISHLSLDPNS